jgi:hypothetical protein
VENPLQSLQSVIPGRGEGHGRAVTVQVVVVAGRVWVDLESLVTFMRDVEGEGERSCAQAQEQGDPVIAGAMAAAVSVVRQVTDGLVLAGLWAGEESSP